VRLLPREIAPPPHLWDGIAARLEPQSRLDRLAASLRTRVDPPKDLWPEIEARIAPRRRLRPTAFALVASAAVAAAVAVAVHFGERGNAGPELGSVAAAANDSASAAGTVGWVLDAPALAGDVAVKLSRELALVRDERLSIEQAIAKEPDNDDLRELWAFTYETELELADECGRTVMEYQRERG
jgi:mevalonate pyrophosphate decarboxylase